jgi:mannose-1-phosphate guanylyltransferase
MRAMLLAAGLGTRLRPITDKIPKCLVPIHGKPLLQIWLERLTAIGIGPFLINTHYLSEQVERFIAESDFSDQVKIIYEPDLLGTAGTLINNVDFFKGEDGLLIHADNYCLSDFIEFIQAHQCRPIECEITMMTFCTDNPSLCGIVEIDKNGVVVGFHEKVSNPPSNLANGAIYILSNKFMEILNRDYAGVNDFSTEVLSHFIGKIYTYKTDRTFIDIGSPKNLSKARI